MQLRHVKIENFRGIKSFEWAPDLAVSCLIGPGDSTKTTILDAIEYALSPRWSVAIVDTDFHGGRFKEPIAITATVGHLPAVLLQEDKFGLELRGWDESGLKDEPEGAAEPVLTVRFSADNSLEPNWHVINDRKPEGRPHCRPGSRGAGTGPPGRRRRPSPVMEPGIDTRSTD